MSRQRSIRKKSFSYANEDDDEGSSVAMPPASVKAAQARRDKEKKRADAKSLLSFDEDLGGGDVPAPNKQKAASNQPRSSLRAPGALKSGDAPTVAPSTQISSAGEYSAERIKELQKNALRAPTAKPADRPPLAGGAFKLSGSFKPAGAPKDSRYQYNVIPAALLQPQTQQQKPNNSGPGGSRAGAEAAEMPLPPPPPPPGSTQAGGSKGTAEGASSAEGAVDVALGDDEDDLDIPDEKMIQWAKAKRERLRSAHLAPDYIPTASMPGLSRLRDKKAQEEAVEAGSRSEEEELEDGMRLKFMGAPGKREGPGGSSGARNAGARQGRLGAAPSSHEGGAQQGGGGGEVEEDEEDHWAKEQIRKGMGGLMRGDTPAVGTAGRQHADQADEAPAAGHPAWGGRGMGMAGGSQAGKINAAAAEVLQSLQHGLKRLQTSHQQAERNLARTTGNLQGSIGSIAGMEEDLKGASEKYVFLQKLRSYMLDLCYMLQDKSPLVEELEDQLMQLREGRAAAFQERRRLDDAESHQPAEAAITAALGVLSRGGTQAAAAASAEVAAEAAERRQAGGDLPPELDEFGRDLNAERTREAAERAKRRQARLAEAAQQLRQRQEQEGEVPPAELRVGEDTSGESEGEAAHFRLRQGEIQEAAAAVFRDASDEYGSLQAVKEQLEGWKQRYPGPYRDAYVSVSAPALFAPFVRLQLLKWQPLEQAAGFDSLQWYQQLFDYGMGPDPAAADPDDPDANLVPQLVQKLILLLAQQLVRGVWDPLSRRSSKAAAAMLGDLLVYVPPEDEGLQGLLRLVQSRLEEAVEATSLPAWPPSAVVASTRAEAYLCQRFGRALRLLRSVCAFEGVLPKGGLQELALQRLVSQRLMPFIRVAASDLSKAVDRVHRTAAALPVAWFKAGPLRGCEGLLDFCNTLARSLEALAGEKGVVAAHAAAAKQLSLAMAKLGGDVGKANRLAKVYGVL